MARRGRVGFWFRFAIVVLKGPTVLLTRREDQGLQHLPDGGYVLAANHIAKTDPFVLGDFVLHGVRRLPRFLAKRSIFEGGGLAARVTRGCEQIPVDRHAADASRALDPAVDALRSGELVVIYPEGTVTGDPDLWPMRARTGVARLALLSGAPVLPVAQWGAQRIDPSRPWRRTRVQLRVGPPVDLAPWRGQELTGEVLREATEAVMDAITAELEVLRGERAPAQRYDPRAVDGRASA